MNKTKVAILALLLLAIVCACSIVLLPDPYESWCKKDCAKEGLEYMQYSTDECWCKDEGHAEQIW